MMSGEEGQKFLARIEAQMALEFEDRAYWLRHQRGEVSVEETAGRLKARLYTARLMLDGVEPAPDKVRASIDELTTTSAQGTKNERGNRRLAPGFL